MNKTTLATKNLEIVENRTEKHGNDIITVTVYKLEEGYTYSINLKLANLIKSKYPHEEDIFATILLAKKNAIEAIKNWTNENRTAKQRFKLFDIQEYRQLELF